MDRLAHGIAARRCVGAVAVLAAMGGAASVYAGPDLDVLYISRTPMYWKYHVEEQYGLDPRDPNAGKPFLAPGDELNPRWPAPGEPVTFRAVIKNPGDAATGIFTYAWYFDGALVKSGVLPSLTAGAQTQSTWVWEWDSEQNDHIVKFIADPANEIAEEVEVNNSRADYTNALSFRLHVWESVYDWFNSNARSVDDQMMSYEDWVQRQLGYINQMFAEAVYPLTPNGVPEHVRLDGVVIEADAVADPDPNACHGPPDLNWDCRWGYTLREYPRIWIENPNFISGTYDWALHEWGHQLGLIDLYQFEVGGGDNFVQPGVAYPRIWNNGLMNDGSDHHYPEYIAYALLSNLHKRRGFFGEYMYDLPSTCRVRLVDAYGRPLAGASATFYQESGNQIHGPADYVRTADREGCIALPNKTVYGSMVTGNGHYVRDNPWGLLHLAGCNGNYFCTIDAHGMRDAQFFEILAFNVGYWSGHRSQWTYRLSSVIVPEGRPTSQNLYDITVPSPRAGHAVGAGGTLLRWNGNTWSAQPSPTAQTLRAVDTHDSSYAYAVGDNGVILKYSSGGWTRIGNSPTTARLWAVAAPTDQLVAIGGENGALYRSTDGGAHWTRVGNLGTVRGIDFRDAVNGALVCANGYAYRTHDGGALWAGPSTLLGSGAPLTGVSMATATEVWACNNDGDVFRSFDGGGSWEWFANYSYIEDWTSIAMKPGGYGWIGGGRHEDFHCACLTRVANYRRTNEPTITTSLTDTINGTAAVTPEVGWVVGNSGLILRLGPSISDLDRDGDEDSIDLGALAASLSGPAVACAPAGQRADADGDGDVDLADFAEFQHSFAGSGQ